MQHDNFILLVEFDGGKKVADTILEYGQRAAAIPTGHKLS